MVDAGRSPAVRLCGVFLAVCVKCVSLDTDGIPPEINPPGPPVPSTPTLHSLSTHHAYSSVCVCVCECVCLGVRVYVGRGSACPVPRHLQGATGKRQLCVWEKTENVEEGMPVKTVTFGVSTNISAAVRLLLTFPFSSSLTSSPRLSLSPVSSYYLALPVCFFFYRCLSLFVLFFCCSVLLCFVKILGCTCQTSLSFHIRRWKSFIWTFFLWTLTCLCLLFVHFIEALFFFLFCLNIHHTPLLQSLSAC